MAEHLEREIQIVDQQAESPTPVLSEAESAGQRAIDEEVGATRMSPEVISLIDRLMAGSEPYSRDLRPWEVEKFNPLHINICTLRAAGFKGVEISKILELDQSRVSQILTHPYGVKLVRALVPKNSIRVLDIRTRLEEYAGDLLDRVYGQAMLEEDVDKVGRVTFGLLDRAGFGAKAPAESGKPSGVVGTEGTMRRLTRALEESEQVNREVMPSWVPRKPPDEGALPVDDVIGSSPRRLAGGTASEGAVSSPLSAAGGQK